MCGIVGIIAKIPVNQDLFDALTALQHRGQDAAGVVTCHNKQLFLCKGNGLVRDAIRSRHMRMLQGNMGIGHVRYPTAGTDSHTEAQPMYVNSPYGITLAHNGNLTNAEQLKRDVIESELRHLNTRSDSEVLLNVFAYELQLLRKRAPDANDFFDALGSVMRRCRGAYAAVAMITGVGILGFRDPHGIRPLVYGVRQTDAGSEYMIASESATLNHLGFELVADIKAGEAIFISMTGDVHRRQCIDSVEEMPCLFEYVYLARPDSMINGASVYQVRHLLGEKLAEKIKREWKAHDIEVVIPIPDTSRTAALPLALSLNLPYREGFVKNRYIGRTFIMPGQSQRKHSVRQKLNTIASEFDGKNVLLVDDSIVRGTTSQEIIQMARDAGAKKVYFASTAPEVRYPNVYGIDMPSANELIAHGRDVEDIRVAIGADQLIFQSLDDLKAAIQTFNPALQRFDTSVFTGEYVTGDIDAAYLQQLERERADSVRLKLSSSDAPTLLDLPNSVDK